VQCVIYCCSFMLSSGHPLRRTFFSNATRPSTRFLVDKGSDLYYDATPLLEIQQQERGDESRSRRTSNVHPHANPMHSQDLYRSNSHGQPQPSPYRSSANQPQTQTPTQNPYPYGGSPVPSRYPSQGGFNSVSPGQFYNGRDTGSPVRPSMGMGHEVMGGMGRRVTRGMVDDGYHGM